MHQRFRDVLAGSDAPWIEVRGSVEDRLSAALGSLAMLEGNKIS